MTRFALPERDLSTATRTLWTVVSGLALIGVLAVFARATYVSDLASRLEPARRGAFAALGRTDPYASDRRAELALVDGRYARHPTLTLLHIIPGGLFLAFAPFQFSPRIRRRFPQVHRWSGRLLIVAGAFSAVVGMVFGVFMPYGGIAESAAIVITGGLFLLAVTRAFVAIRRKDIATHRLWMSRALGIALGISVVRVLAPFVDLALTPYGAAPRTVFLVALWVGWGATIAATEAWLVRPRNRKKRFLIESY